MRGTIESLRRLLRIAAIGALLAYTPTAAGAQTGGASASAGVGPGLEMRFLDVGQGDAILLRSGGRTALIDAGPSDLVVRRLRELGVDSISLLIISHNHADHLGGADAVIDSIPVRFYLENGVPAGTAAHERVLMRVAARGVTALRAEARSFALGSARIHVAPAPPNDGEGQNNRSLVVIVEQGEFSALLTGDSEIPQINAMLAVGVVPDVDLVKAAHHGSRNGLTPAWLARTRPEVVVVSVGARNNFGHPTPFAMRYYHPGRRSVFRTDRHGEVTLHVSAEGRYRVSTARSGEG